jgi:2C-methyl-D-erythritol 2,4-cyclodiphosphate synthase
MPNKNRTLVKLDDTIIEIKEGKKGLEATRLSDEDLCEVSLLDEGVGKMIENDINKLANEAYTELQDNFKTVLKSNVLKVVGFENNWHNNGWEVDHCNGRASYLTEFMSNKVKSMFAEEFDKLLQPEIEKMIKPLKAALVKEFKEVFNYQVKSQMRESAQVAAADFLANVMQNEVKKFQRKALEKAELAFLGRKSKLTEDSEE